MKMDSNCTCQQRGTAPSHSLNSTCACNSESRDKLTSGDAHFHRQDDLDCAQQTYRCFRRSGSVSSVSSTMSNGNEGAATATASPVVRPTRQRRVGFCMKSSQHVTLDQQSLAAAAGVPYLSDREEMVSNTIQSNMFELERLAVNEAKMRRASDTVVARAAAAAASHSRMLIMNEMASFGSLMRTPQGSTDGLAQGPSSSSTIVNSSLASSIGSGITVIQEPASAVSQKNGSTRNAAPQPPNPYVAMAAACAAALNAPQLLSQLGSAFTPYLTLAATIAAQQASSVANVTNGTMEQREAAGAKPHDGDVDRRDKPDESARSWNENASQETQLTRRTQGQAENSARPAPEANSQSAMTCTQSTTSPAKNAPNANGSTFNRTEQRHLKDRADAESADNSKRRTSSNSERCATSADLLRRLMNSEPDARYFTQRVTSILLSEVMMSNTPSLSGGATPESAGEQEANIDVEERDGRESASSRSSQNLERDQAQKTLLDVCNILERLLHDLIEWARQAYLFRSVPLDDQILLLQGCWMDLLILTVVQFKWRCSDLIHALPYDVTKRVVQILVDVLNLKPICTKLAALMKRFEELNVNYEELILLKYQVLLNADTSKLQQHETIETYQEQLTVLLQEKCADKQNTQTGFGGYNLNDRRQSNSSSSESHISSDCRSNSTCATTDRYTLLLLLISELRLLSMHCEESLLRMHLAKRIPDNLLVEMLYHKHRRHLPIQKERDGALRQAKNREHRELNAGTLSI